METQTKNEKQQLETADKNVPERKFSTGAISATIWKNARLNKEGALFESHSVSLQRRYADKSGKWQSTSSLRINDLPRAALVLEEAYKYLVMQGADEDGIKVQPAL